MAGEIKVGDNSVRIISVETTFDPETGWQDRIRIEGEEDAVRVEQFAYAARGFRCNIYPHDGPVWRGDFTGTSNQDQTGLPEIVDQWEFETQFVQESIYNNPKVLASVGYDDDSLSIAAKEIEESIADHLTLSEFIDKYQIPTPPSALQAVAIGLYVLRLRGQVATEIERCVLRRVRTIPVDSASRATQDAVPKVYTTAALIATFGIPADIAALLPATPASSDVYSTWAWKKQRDASSIIPQLGKCQETREWVFASWANATYTLITA